MEILINILIQLSYILIYPGILFLAVYGMFCEWWDRKLYAQMQNRQGPSLLQPLADFIKLLSKEIIIPANVTDKIMFLLSPVTAIAAIVTTAMIIPIDSLSGVISFKGDLIAVVYLLSLPTISFFLIGWSSQSPYSAVGAMRVITQLFAYEVPLMLVLLGPAILAGSWNVSEIASFFAAKPWYMIFNIPGLIIAVVTLQGKLERVPFDSPHAETEIVGGAFTEYTGRLYGAIRLVFSMEMVVVCALVNAVFLGGSFGTSGLIGFAIFIVKTMALVFLLALMRALMARVRIEQMVEFCWKVLAPLSLLQIVINILVKGFING
ncbi:NADH-quinone oxidoreductase subunit H [Parelusimicrobium proximum]|uniref:complex I subunit 1 family protein n=1 Tax=Parelusimicrobium proximum TaxID=3228953 RepID=UPI003D16C751